MANGRRRLIGRVTSNKMEKTVVVSIESRKMHPIYKKVVKTTKKLMAHDESNAIEMGAIVRVVESKPMSKRKRWVVEEVMAVNAKGEIPVLSDEIILANDGADETQDTPAATTETVDATQDEAVVTVDNAAVAPDETVASGTSETVVDGDAVSEDEAVG